MKDIGDSSKQVAKNTVMLYIRQFFILFLNLYTVRLVLNVLGETDYGVYIVAAGFVTMFSVFSGAMSQACQRYFCYDLGIGDYKKLNTTFTLSLLIHVLIAIIALLLTETIGLWYVANKLIIPDGRYDAALFIYQSSILVLILTIIITPYMAMVLAKEDMNIYAIISIGEAVLKLVSIIVIGKMAGDRLILYGISFIIVEVFVVAAYFGVRKIKYYSLKLEKNLDKETLKELLGFAGWNLFGSLIYPLKVQGINIIYNQTFGNFVVPGRGIAASVSSAVTSFYTNFGNAIRPQIVKRYATDGDDSVMSIVYAGSKITYYLTFAVMFPLIAEMKLVLGIWLENENIPQFAIVFSQLALIEALIDSVSNPLTALVGATGKIRKYELVVSGLQLCNLPLTVLLFAFIRNPLITYVIAIVLAILCLIARVVILSGITRLGVKDYIFNVVFKAVSFSLIPAVVIYGMKMLLSIQGIIAVIPLYIIFELLLLGVFYIFVFDRKEKKFLRRMIKRK